MHSTYNYSGFVDIYRNISRQSNVSRAEGELPRAAQPAPQQSGATTGKRSEKTRRQHLKLIRS